MKKTNWIGKSGGKASDPDNWDNGVPNYRTEAIVNVDDRTEIIWDLKSLGIPVDIQGNKDNVILLISGDCMVGGAYFVPDVIRDHFESFKQLDLNPDTFDRPPPGTCLFKTGFTSKDSGDWDSAGQTTWNESGYPQSGDTALIQDTHTVTIKDAQACGNVTVESGGELEFDGQTDSVDPVLVLDSGSELSNSGTVEALDCGGTATATLTGTTGGILEVFSGNNDPSFGDNYWLFEEIEFQVDISTEAGCTIDIGGQCRFDAIYLANNATLNGNDATLLIGGDVSFQSTSDWNYGTSTFQIEQSITLGAYHGGGDPNDTWYKFTQDSGATITISSTQNIYTEDVMTLNADFTVDGETLFLYPGKDSSLTDPLVVGGSTDLSTVQLTHFQDIDVNFNVPGTMYGTLWIRSNHSITASLTGAITCAGDLRVFSTQLSGATPTLDTTGNDNSVTCTKLVVGWATENGIFLANDSIVDVGRDATGYGVKIDSAASYIDLGGSSWTVAGNWSNDSTSGSWDEGTSTIEFDGTTPQLIETGGKPFKNLEINNSHASLEVKFSENLDVNGTLLFTDGQINMNTYNPSVNTYGNVTFINGCTLTHGTGTWTFDGTLTYTDNNDWLQDIGISVVSGGVTVTIHVGIFVSGLTINATGILTLDGQSDTVDSKLLIEVGTNIQIDGTLNETGTGSTGSALLSGNTSGYAGITNGAPVWSDGYWILARIDLQEDLTTDGSGCTIRIYNFPCQFVNVTITANDTIDGTGGTLKVSGNWNNSGTFISWVSLVDFNGSDEQDVNPGGDSFYTIDIHNSHGSAHVDFTDALSVNNLLNIEDGIIDPENNIVTVGHQIFISSGTTLLGGSSTIYCGGYWTNNGTFTCNTSTVVLNGTDASTQVLTAGGNPFNNLTFNNSHATAEIRINGDLDINGTFLLSDGQIDMDTYNPAINTAGNVTISNGCTIRHGTGTWTFDGNNKTYTDNNETAQNIGDITISYQEARTALILATHIRFIDLFINVLSGFSSGNQTIYCEGDWTNSGSFAYGTSHVHFDGTTTITGMINKKFYDVTVESGKTVIIVAKVSVTGTTTGCFTDDQAKTFDTLFIEGDCTIDGKFYVSKRQTEDVCP